MKAGRYMFASVVFLIILLSLAAAGCRPVAEPPGAPQGPPTARTPAPSSWDELVKAAQKEGTVNVYATAVGPAIAPMREAFKRKFGIDLDFVEGRPPEVMAKLTAERKAGLYLADVGNLGETTSMMDIKPLGITAPLADLLALPEVKSPEKWIGGKLPFLDQDKHVLMFTAMAIPPGVVNTDMVKEGALTSWLDLLKPEWKGKIVFSDPTVSGSSPNMLASLVKTFGKSRTMEIMQQLAAQEPTITRDQRLLQEWVARGKSAIGLGPSIGLITEFKKAGAPIEITKFKEPRHISGGPGNLIVFINNPHPKATQLYINWLLTAEGLSIWSKALGYPSTRTDVSVEGLDPVTLPRATDVFPDEEQMPLRVEMRKLSSDVFARLIK